MKTLLKIIAVAAAFGLGTSAAGAQTPVGGPPPANATTQLDPEGAATGQPAAAPGAPDPSAAGAPLVAGNTAGPAPGAASNYTSPVSVAEGIGVPDGRWGLQDQFSPIGREAAWFHDWILMPAITIISLFVLALMLWVIMRYRRAANPVPSRTTHNTFVEVVWTLLPVLILVVIAIPSIRLLANQYSPPAADLTIKVIGNQWYWDYEYPDHGITITSNMLREQAEVQAGQRFRTEADGPRLLAVDERIVVPVGATVKLIVTSADVIHAFALPAFWVKIDAVPGRLNETWFQAERTGVFFGQCSELCGSRHAYMPIAIEVVEPADFARWVASRGGSMPGAAPPGADAMQNLQSAPPAPTGEATPQPSNVVEATTNQPLVRERSAEPLN